MFAVKQFDGKHFLRYNYHAWERRHVMKKDCIGNDVRILSHQIHRWIENSPNKKKIDSCTGTNAWIIGYISDKTEKNEDVYQKDLEKCFEITRSTASKVVNLMVEKGMVERQSVPWDARLKKLVLTDKEEKSMSLCWRISVWWRRRCPKVFQSRNWHSSLIICTACSKI